tara:strand:- start:287 stop:412 length:126 start_codon:yes stop_codon:yes gene_type:complete
MINDAEHLNIPYPEPVEQPRSMDTAKKNITAAMKDVWDEAN